MPEKKNHNCKGPERFARAFVLTASDSRDLDSDLSGQTIVRLLEEKGHQVLGRQVEREDSETFAVALEKVLSREDCNLVIVNGGTGLSPRDGTFEVIEKALKKQLPGFGELFRMRSWDQVGPFAMISRACAGLSHQGPLLFSLPGSTKACTLAMEELILPTLSHLLKEIVKK